MMTDGRSRPLARPWSMLAAGVIAIALALGGPGAALANQEPPPGGGNDCTNVTFVGARGSGQSADGYDGVGPTVDGLAVVMKGILAAHHKSMTIFPDEYPAVPVSVLKPSKKELALLAVSPALGIYEYKKNYYDHFVASIERGTHLAIKDAVAMLNVCPHTKIVFAGYSQGAMAIHQAELDALAHHRHRLLRHLAGTLLIGDGDRIPGTRAHQFGSASSGADGIRTWAGGNGGEDVPFPSTTAEICTHDDIVCDFASSHLLHASHAVHVHSGYVRGTYARPSIGDAATWLAELIS